MRAADRWEAIKTNLERTQEDIALLGLRIKDLARPPQKVAPQEDGARCHDCGQLIFGTRNRDRCTCDGTYSYRGD